MLYTKAKNKNNKLLKKLSEAFFKNEYPIYVYHAESGNYHTRCKGIAPNEWGANYLVSAIKCTNIFKYVIQKEVKIIINRLEQDKINFDNIGIKYENPQYIALEEAINAMYKLAKEIQ